MKKILFLLVFIVLLSNTIAYAGGVVGRVTHVDLENNRVYICIDNDEPDRDFPAAGDIVFSFRAEDLEFGNMGLIVMFQFAHNNMDSYYCYVNNGGYQSSGGQQSVCFAQLLPRTDSLESETRRLTIDIQDIRNRTRYLWRWILFLYRRIK